MKRLLAILLAAVLCPVFAFADSANPAEIDLAALEWTLPVTHLSGDFVQEGAPGQVMIAAKGREASDSGETITVEPYVPESLDRVIVGTDNRVPVRNAQEYPYSAIANMKVTGGCGCKWECTGYMVGRNFLLTAAHCMICPDHGRWADCITFWFGYRNERNYLCKYTGNWQATAGTSFDGGYSFEEMTGDWCYVKLEENIGEQTGWLGFSTASDDEILSRFYTVAGYRDNQLKYDRGSAAVYDRNLITFRADDVAGNSGGPIFLNDTDIADAIIIAEDAAAEINIGRRITVEIWKYMQEDGYQ